MPKEALNVDGMRKSFGSHEVLKGISLYAATALTVTRTFRLLERRFNRHLQPRTG